MGDNELDQFGWRDLRDDEPLLLDEGGPTDAILFRSDSAGMYVVSFEEAARVLEECASTGHGGQDGLLLPILYCYRHALELSLKSIIAIGDRLNGRTSGPPFGHDLDALWREARRAIDDALPDRNGGVDADRVGSIIHQLSEIDGASSTAFRYPFSKDRAPSLPRDLQRVNITHFGLVMRLVRIWLDGAETMMWEFAAERQGWQ